jgi:hypothetical protein
MIATTFTFRRFRLHANAFLPLVMGSLLACNGLETDVSEEDEEEVDSVSQAVAIPPPGEIVNVETNDAFGSINAPDATVFYARTAPRFPGAPHRYWWRVDVRVHNGGGAPMTVTSFGLDTDVDPNQNAVLDVPVVIPAGGTSTIVVPGGLAGDVMPSSMVIKVNVSGYLAPITKSISLAAFESNTQSGGYRFPFAQADFAQGDYLGVGAHENDSNQKWALDVGGRRWNDDLDKWDSLTAAAYGHANPGSINGDFIIWNKPVRALGNGTIRRCWRSMPDQVPGVKVDGGGNTLIVELGNGEWASYHHLKQNSIPAALCPIEGNVGANWLPIAVPVVEGQLLGRVGNTGHSTGPHLHLQIDGEAPTPANGTVRRSLPINFFGVLVHHADGYNPNVDPPGWSLVPVADPAALYSNMLMLPVP